MALWVKICANTSLADALLAVEAGADAVGFVFAPSRRQVTVAQVAAICADLPAGVERVGVFAGAGAAEIAEAVRGAGLTAVQLHDGLNLPAIEALRALLPPEIRLIHTIHWTLDDREAAHEVAQALDVAAKLPHADRLLLDAKVGSASGGLGVGYDHAAAARVLAGAGERAVIVAGGLRPENVAEALRAMRPFGVDVASGVEQSPGKKNREKLRAFIHNARTC